jgi:hypothetical protein
MMKGDLLVFASQCKASLLGPNQNKVSCLRHADDEHGLFGFMCVHAQLN